MDFFKFFSSFGRRILSDKFAFHCLRKTPVRLSTTFSSRFRKHASLISVSFRPYPRQTLNTDRKFASDIPSPRKRQSSSGSPISWTTVAFTVAIGTGLVLALKSFKQKKEEEIDADMIRSYGRPELGGDFELVDQNGEVKSNRDFIGKWILIYFGFTNCPDICPEELEKMGHVVDIVNRSEVVPNLLPLFISIDPERDSPPAVKKYIADFHPSMIGLTGTRDQIDTASRAFRVYYSTGPKDGDEDYLVDHTVIMYLIDENGEFCEYYGQTRSAGEIASNIIATMLKTRKNLL